MMRLLLFICILTTGGLAQQPTAGTITLGLFTTRTIHSLTVAPRGANAWQQNCVTCQHTALHAPVHLEHLNQPIQLGGNFRIQSDGDVPPIEAAGVYTITHATDGLRVTLRLSSERYVAAVLSAEAAPDEPSASLEALAITARTFAMGNLRRHKAENFDLCDSTHCQALHLGPLRPAIAQAVRNTAGISLWYGHRLASVYYTQHCGGVAEAASALWPDERAPYLVSHMDSYCLRRSADAWHEQKQSLPAACTSVSTAPSGGTASAAISIQSSSPMACFISPATAMATASASARPEPSRWRSNTTPPRRSSPSTFPAPESALHLQAVSGMRRASDR